MFQTVKLIVPSKGLTSNILTILPVSDTNHIKYKNLHTIFAHCNVIIGNWVIRSVYGWTSYITENKFIYT